MNEHDASQAKVRKPATHFEEPHDVVLDPALSKKEKVEALETLEQDARQLSMASSEGMNGGEANKLHEVLRAKDSLDLPLTAYAYDVVLQDLRARQRKEVAHDTRALIERAIAALDPLLKSFVQQSDTAACRPEPASDHTDRAVDEGHLRIQ